MKTVTVYTDGACSGNPGPGGWGAILEYGPHVRELSGGEVQTTNNRMELTAVIVALEKLKEPCIVELYSDSKYVLGLLGKRLGLQLGEKQLGQKRQKACPQCRSVAAAFGADPPSYGPFPLGQRPCR